MRKVFIVLAMLFLAAQFVNAKKLYVEMKYEKNSIKIDDGSNKKPQTIKGINGKDLKFNSLVGALNYMSFHGWELIDTKNIIEGGGYNGLSQTKLFITFSVKKFQKKN